MVPTEQSVTTCRRALEALRNGVPNRDAVRLLGCHQPEAERQFDELLTKAADVDAPPEDALGLLVSGDFGAGKSHLLTYLEQLTLSRGFVCSRVAISKETPLYDLGKVYKSAVENGRLPKRRGRLIEELGQSLNFNSAAYARLYEWTNRAAEAGIFNRMFPASLMVYERLNGDLDLHWDIERFWAGEKIKISRVKDGLRQIGQYRTYTFGAPKAAELPSQWLRFATQLIKGAGYKGWVVLLDEIELIGSYSLLQRGRAYAELARWIGKAVGEKNPGLVVVGTVSGDFATAIISTDGKKDRDYVGPKMASSRYMELAPRAETGMRLLEQACQKELGRPAEADIQDTLEKLRQVYSTAYGWDAPPLAAEIGGDSHRNRMRYRVRAAINEWDLRRLYPGATPEIEGEEYRLAYTEDRDLERGSENESTDSL